MVDVAAMPGQGPLFAMAALPEVIPGEAAQVRFARTRSVAPEKLIHHVGVVAFHVQGDLTDVGDVANRACRQRDRGPRPAAVG